jgi:hypothetical protein
MKLIYPNGTIVEAKERPANFTGTVAYEKGKNYYLNGRFHRDGGLPVREWSDYNSYYSYWVNGKRTGYFVP